MSRDEDRWALQDAKARLSEVVDRAGRTGRPQLITRRGQEAAVLISPALYHKLADRRSRKSLLEFFAQSPLAELPDATWDAILDRSKDTGRTVELE